MTNKNDFHPQLPPRPPYRPRSRLQRALRWLDASDPFGRVIEWILVVLVVIFLIAVVAIASRNIDGDLDTSAKVIEEQHERAIIAPQPVEVTK